MEDKLKAVYTMDVETSDDVKQHPYHLGTDFCIAETFVKEELMRVGVKSITLRKDKKVVKIYDYRDLELCDHDFSGVGKPTGVKGEYQSYCRHCGKLGEIYEKDYT